MDMKELAKKYNLTQDDYWKESRSGKWIISHDACEKIADMEKKDTSIDELTDLLVNG